MAQPKLIVKINTKLNI